MRSSIYTLSQPSRFPMTNHELASLVRESSPPPEFPVSFDRSVWQSIAVRENRKLSTQMSRFFTERLQWLLRPAGALASITLSSFSAQALPVKRRPSRTKIAPDLLTQPRSIRSSPLTPPPNRDQNNGYPSRRTCRRLHRIFRDAQQWSRKERASTRT